MKYIGWKMAVKPLISLSFSRSPSLPINGEPSESFGIPQLNHQVVFLSCKQRELCVSFKFFVSSVVVSESCVTEPLRDHQYLCLRVRESCVCALRAPLCIHHYSDLFLSLRGCRLQTEPRKTLLSLSLCVCLFGFFLAINLHNIC